MIGKDRLSPGNVSTTKETKSTKANQKDQLIRSS